MARHPSGVLRPAPLFCTKMLFDGSAVGSVSVLVSPAAFARLAANDARDERCPRRTP